MQKIIQKGIETYRLIFLIYNIALFSTIFYCLVSFKDSEYLNLPNDTIQFSQASIFAIFFLSQIILCCGYFYVISIADDMKNFQVACYSLIGKLLILLMFLSLYGFSLLFGEITSENLLESTCATGYFKNVNDTQLKLKEIWCKSKNIEPEQVDIGCGCFISDYSIWSEQDQQKLKNVNEYSKIESSEQLGETTIEECSYFKKIIKHKEKEVQIIKKMEYDFECSGICESDILYYFKDVSQSIPKSKQGCFQFVIESSKKIISYMQILAKIYFYSLLFDSIVFFICKFQYLIYLLIQNTIIKQKFKTFILKTEYCQEKKSKVQSPQRDFQILQNIDSAQRHEEQSSEQLPSNTLNL